MVIKNVKGGYDYLPNEQKIRNYINDTLRGVFEQFGYKPIETPILCYYDILSDKYDEDSDILKEIYQLSDQGNRKLGLRYDLTVPFAKFIALNKNNITIPFKRYEIAKVFRDGPVKLGRDREFTQCDVDVVGLEGELIEAELMMLFAMAFKKLDIDIVIKYNSRKLMSGLILNAKIDDALVSSVTTIIDKKDKISGDEFKESLENLGIADSAIRGLRNDFDLSLEELSDKYKGSSNNLIVDGIKEVNSLTNYLKSLNLDGKCEFCSSLARGQNYYTGNVFEVYERKGKISGSIGAGGRYDMMISEFIDDGSKYPTVGISFGLSSIYELLKDRICDNTSSTDIYIIPINTNIESLKLAGMLRNLGYNVEVEMQNRKLKNSLSYVNKEKIPYAIILGEDEINSKMFKLKNMNDGTETIINISNLEDVKNMIDKQ